MDLLAASRRLDGQQYSAGLVLCLVAFWVLGSAPSWASEDLPTAATEAETTAVSDAGLETERSAANTAGTTEPALPAEDTAPVGTVINVEALATSTGDPATLSPAPATTVEEWLAQSLVTITDVRVEATEAGLQIVLTTAGGDLTAPATQAVGEALIAEIPNAVLDLPEGEPFEQFAPAGGIALVQVASLPGDRVQVVITGVDAVPEVTVGSDAAGLILSVVPGITQVDENEEAIQLVVTGEEAGAEYFVPDASSILRTDTPIRDTPSSVQVIPQQVIEDQNATNVREIVRNAAGINFANAQGNRSEQFILRGFAAEQFRYGFRDDGDSSATERELANIDRVEVLRGPASILFGRAEPSGIINFVTKQPLREPFYKAEFTAGSFDFYRPTLDISGPLTEDRSLAYRLNAAYENAGSFRDGVETERFFVAPTLSWQTSDDTELSFEYSYLKDTRPIDRGLVVLSDDEVADIPFSTYLGDPDIRENFEEHSAELRLDHRFTSNLSLRSRLRYTASTEAPAESGAGGFSEIFGSSEDDRNFPTAEFRLDQFRRTFTFQNDLIGEFSTGSVEHTVLFGLEYATAFRSARAERRSTGVIDIFNASAFNRSTDEPFELRRDQEERDNTFGIYLQDQIAILDNLQMVIGGRFDFFNSETENLIDGEISETEAEAFSPRLGIVYQPVEPVSLYASYTHSFTPVGGADVDGEPFDPERGTGFEVGVKADIIPDRLFSTLALYNTTLTNVTTSDPDNPGFDIQTGEQRSRGIELDIQGEILPGWNIFAGYAYTDAEITEDNDIPEGNRLTNVPEHNFNLWTNYTIQEGDFTGLGFGAGVFYVSERAGDLDNSFFVDGYTRVDAAISYERDNYRFGLNFQNLFDSKFIEATQGRRRIRPGAPFTLLGTVSIEF